MTPTLPVAISRSRRDLHARDVRSCGIERPGLPAIPCVGLVNLARIWHAETRRTGRRARSGHEPRLQAALTRYRISARTS